LSRPALAAVLAAAACATARPIEKVPWPGAEGASAPAAAGGAQPAAPAPAPAPAELTTDELASLDPVAWAGRQPRGAACEAAARALLPRSRDKAWATLRACVQRGRFTELTRVVDGAWEEELRSRPDAGVVIAAIVAARGGDVTGDLGSLRQRRIPIFSLGPSISHPDLYKGRLVMLRARVDDIRTEKGRTTVQLAEFAVGGRTHWVEGNTRAVRNSTARGSASVDVTTSRYGSAQGSAKFDRNSTTTWGRETKRHDNVAEETGNLALAKLASPDPFFEPGRQFIVLGRFEGVRQLATESEDATSTVAVMSVVAYFEPAAMMLE
jgi:hypothetical protein